MKRTLRTVCLILALCFTLSLLPSAALAGEYFPHSNYRYAEATDEAQALYDELVAKVSAIKDGAKHSSSNMKKISAYVEKIEKIESKTSQITSAAKHQKAIALKKYRRYSDAIKIWESLAKQWRKDKNWDALFETYLCIGDTHMLSGSTKKAHKAYSSALAVEKESKLSLSTTAKKSIEDKITPVNSQPSEKTTKSTKLGSLKILVQEKAKLAVSVEGPNKKSVTFTSSDSAIALVNNEGIITGVKEGKATVTITVGAESYEYAVTVSKPKQVNMKDIAAEVLKLVNDEREKAGVSKVSLDDTLMEAASIRAQECVVFFDHKRPNGTYYHTVLDEVGISKSALANYSENIAQGNLYKTPQDVMAKGWMRSEGHRSNILDRSFKKMGIGLAYDNSGRPTWVQLFTS